MTNWASIAAKAHRVPGLKVEIVDDLAVIIRLPSNPCPYMLPLGRYTPTDKIRSAALLIVDAIEAATDWRFYRDDCDGEVYWIAKHPNGRVEIDYSNEKLPEHESLLAVIDKVMEQLGVGE